MCRNKTSILGEGAGLTRSACVNASPPGLGAALPPAHASSSAARACAAEFSLPAFEDEEKGEKRSQRETN